MSNISRRQFLKGAGAAALAVAATGVLAGCFLILLILLLFPK